jgi:hypothetical protein
VYLCAFLSCILFVKSFGIIFLSYSPNVNTILSLSLLHTIHHQRTPKIYYIFGFLFLVMIILVATCAETTILMCYFQLCNEDYRWWWRSMFASGSCAGYIFVYAIWYFVVELEIEG